MIGYVPVASRKVIDARGGGSVREILTKDVQDWSRDQIITALRIESSEAVAQQIRLGNPPTIAVIDRTKGKPLREAVRTVDITFGDNLKPKALAVVENALRIAINKATRRKTGRLANLKNWRWIYSRNGRVTNVPIVGASGIPLGPRDFLALKPESVPHSTVANRRAAGLTFKRTKKGNTRKADQGLGFLAYAARQVKRHPLLKGFRVAVRFTQSFRVPGELSKVQGTGYIIVTPETGRRRKGY